MNKLCQVHINEELQFVSLNHQEKCIFKCIKCIEEFGGDPNRLIEIQQILSSDRSTFFSKSFSENNILFQHVDSLDISSIRNLESRKLFYKEVFNELYKQIREKEEFVMKKMDEKINLNELLLKKLSDFSFIVHFKSIIEDVQKPIKNQQKEIVDLLEDSNMNQTYNHTVLSKIIEQISEAEETIKLATDNIISFNKFSGLNFINKQLIFKQEELQMYQESYYEIPPNKVKNELNEMDDTIHDIHLSDNHENNSSIDSHEVSADHLFSNNESDSVSTFST